MGQGLGCCRTVYLSRSIMWFYASETDGIYTVGRKMTDHTVNPHCSIDWKKGKGGQEALMRLCWAVIGTFKKKLYSVLHSIWHQYKLNLRNKAGWRLHFAVHACCAFYGWKYNTPLNPPVFNLSLLSDKKHPWLSQRPGETVQYSYPGPWAGGAKGSEPWWQVVRPVG